MEAMSNKKMNLSLTNFELEVKQLEWFIDKTEHHNWRTERQIRNNCLDIIRNYRRQIVHDVFQGTLLRVGKFMIQNKLNRLAWDVCLSNYFEMEEPLTSFTLDKIKSLLQHQYFTNGDEKHASLLLNMIMNFVVWCHDKEVEQDKKYHLNTSFEHAKQTLGMLQTLTDLCAQFHCRAWVAYNGIIHIYDLSKRLVDCGLAHDALLFLFYAYQMLNSSTYMQNKSSYFSWVNSLAVMFCIALYCCGYHSKALDFAQQKANDLGQYAETNVADKQALSSLEVIWKLLIFKYNIYVRPKAKLSESKSPLKRGGSVNVAPIEAIPLHWPRNETEKQLEDLFRTRRLQSKAVMEALGYRNYPAFHVEMLEPVENFDNIIVLKELFEAGQYLVNDMEVSTAYFTLTLKLVKYCYQFEQWDQLGEILSTTSRLLTLSQKNLVSCDNERKVVLLELQLFAALNDVWKIENSSQNFIKHLGKAAYYSAPSEVLYQLAWAIEACIDYWANNIDQDLILHSALWLWEITFDSIYRINPLFHFGPKYKNVIPWKELMQAIFRTLTAADYYKVDPVLTAEVVLRFANTLLSSASEFVQGSRKSSVDFEVKVRSSWYYLHHISSEEQMTIEEKQVNRLQIAIEAVEVGLKVMCKVRTWLENPKEASLQSTGLELIRKSPTVRRETGGAQTEMNEHYHHLLIECVADFHLELLSVHIQLKIKLSSLMQDDGSSSRDYMSSIEKFGPQYSIRALHLVHLCDTQREEMEKSEMCDLAVQSLLKCEWEHKQLSDYANKCNEDTSLPQFLSRTHHVIWFAGPKNSPIHEKTEWNCLFGKSAIGPINHVKITDDNLNGTGSLVSNKSDIFEIKGLTQYQYYVFALANYNDGQFTVGPTSIPIQACFTFPLLLQWAQLAKHCYNCSCWKQCMKCSERVWNHFLYHKKQLQQDQVIGLKLNETQLHIKNHIHIVTSALLSAAFAFVKHHSSSDGRKWYSRSIVKSAKLWASRITEMFFMTLHHKMMSLAIQLFLAVYNLYLPYIRIMLFDGDISKNLRELFGNLGLVFSHEDWMTFQVKNQRNFPPFIGICKIIASISFYLGSFATIIKDNNDQALEHFHFGLKLMRIIFRSSQDEQDGAIFVSPIIHTLQSGANVSKSNILPAKHFPEDIASALEILWLQLYEDDLPKNLTGNEESLIAHAYIAQMSSEEANEIVNKFRGHSSYPTLLLPLIKVALWEGWHENVLLWCSNYIKQLKRKDEELLEVKKVFLSKRSRRASRISTTDEVDKVQSVETVTNVTVKKVVTEAKKELNEKPKGKSKPEVKLQQSKEIEHIKAVLVPIVNAYTRRKYLRSVVRETQPNKAAFNGLMAVAKFMAVLNVIRPASDQELISCCSILDIDSFSLAITAGVIIPYCNSENSRNDSETVEENLRIGCLYFSRALVLAARHELWLLFVNTCTQLLNCIKLIKNCLWNYHGKLDSFPKLINEFWRPLYFASIEWLSNNDKIFRRSQMLPLAYPKVKEQVIIKAMESLMLVKKYERLCDVGSIFVQQNMSPTLSINLYPLILHCSLIIMKKQKTKCAKKVETYSPLVETLLKDYCRLLDRISEGKRMVLYARRLLTVYLAQQSVTGSDKQVEVVFLPNINIPSSSEVKETLDSHTSDCLPAIKKSTIVEAYSKSISLLALDDVHTALELIHELGSLYVLWRDYTKARDLFLKALDVVFPNPKEFNWKTKMSEFILETADMRKDWVNACNGEYGCLLVGIITVKLARYTEPQNHNEWIQWLLLASALFTSIFWANGIHPTLRKDYSLYVIYAQNVLIPGYDLLLDRPLLNAGTVLYLLEWLSKQLVTNHYSLMALPVLTLHQYIAEFIAVSHHELVKSYLLRTEALISLMQFSDVLTVYQWVVEKQERPFAAPSLTISNGRKFHQQSYYWCNFDDAEPLSQSGNWSSLMPFFDNGTVWKLVEQVPLKSGNAIFLSKAFMMTTFQARLIGFANTPERNLCYGSIIASANDMIIPELYTPLYGNELYSMLSQHIHKLYTVVAGRIHLVDPKGDILFDQYVELQEILAKQFLNSRLPFLSAWFAMTALHKMQLCTKINNINMHHWLSFRLILTKAMVEQELCKQRSEFSEVLHCALDGAAEAEFCGNHSSKAEFLMWIAIIKTIMEQSPEISLQEALKCMKCIQYFSEHDYKLEIQILSLAIQHEWKFLKVKNTGFQRCIEYMDWIEKDIEKWLILRRYPTLDEICKQSKFKFNVYSELLNVIAQYLLLKGTVLGLQNFLLNCSEGLIQCKMFMEVAIRLNDHSSKKLPGFNAIAYYNIANVMKVTYHHDIYAVLETYCNAIEAILEDNLNFSLLKKTCLQVSEIVMELQEQLSSGANDDHEHHYPDLGIAKTQCRFLQFLVISVAVLASEVLTRRSFISNTLSPPTQMSINFSPTIIQDIFGIHSIVEMDSTKADLNLSAIMARYRSTSPSDISRRTDSLRNELTWNQLVTLYETLYGKYKGQVCDSFSWTLPSDCNDDTFWRSSFSVLFPYNTLTSEIWTYRLLVLDKYLAKESDTFVEKCLVPNVHQMMTELIDSLKKGTSHLIDRETILQALNLSKENFLFIWKYIPVAEKVREFFYASSLILMDGALKLASGSKTISKELIEQETKQLDYIVGVYTTQGSTTMLDDINLVGLIQNLLPHPVSLTGAKIPPSLENLNALQSLLKKDFGIISLSDLNIYS